MIKNKIFKMMVGGVLAIPIALNAEESFFKDRLPSIIKNIGNGFEIGKPTEAVESEVKDYTLELTNVAIDTSEEL